MKKMILKYKDKIIDTENTDVLSFEAQLVKKYNFNESLNITEGELTIIGKGLKKVGYDFSKYIIIGKLDLQLAEKLIEDIKKNYINKTEFYNVETKLEEIKQVK